MSFWAVGAVAVVGAASAAASASAQSDAAGQAMDAETQQQLNGMEAAARAGVEANSYLNPYEYTGQMGNYALGNELGITPSMPGMPVKKDFMYLDPRAGQMVLNEKAWRQANNQWRNGLQVAAQYGGVKMDAMPQTSDPKYRNKKGKFDNKKFAADMQQWDRQLQGVMQATNTDSQYSKAPTKQQFMEPVLNKNGKKVRNPDGTVKKKLNEDKFNAALKDYEGQIHGAAGQYWNQYQNSEQAKTRGTLLKEYGASDYAKDPMKYSTDLSMTGYKKDPGYSPMVYDEATWQQANDPTYLAKKGIITNDAEWKASGDPRYLAKKGIITNDAEWRASGDPTYMAPVNTLADLQATPGYKFGLDQGLNSAQTSAAAGGSLMSGATLKALSDYGSGYASQRWMDYSNMQADRFNNAYSRSMDYDNTLANRFGQAFQDSMQYDNARASRFNDAFQRGQGAYLNYFNRAQSAYQQAFNRNQQNKQFRLNALTQQQNVGLTAANAQSNNTMQTGAQQQTGYNNIGNAQAQGYINQGQAQANMYTGISNAVSSGIGNYAMMNAVGNPNTRTSPTGNINGQRAAWDSNAGAWVSY
jgi:hypothetical protein